MGVVNRFFPVLEIDLGSKKLYYSSESVRVKDGDFSKQYRGLIKSEGGISRSFSLKDMKASVSVAHSVTVTNEDRLQDFFNDFPEGLSSARMSYLCKDDATALIDSVYGVASDPKWSSKEISFSVKDSQKLRFKNVPTLIFGEDTFQTSVTLSDSTAYTRAVMLGDPSGARGALVSRTVVANVVSGSFGGKPTNYWKGARLDVIMDHRASDDTNNCSGQFAVVVRSADTTVFLNTAVDTFMPRTDETTTSIINNTLMSFGATYETNSLILQCVRNAVPQNADSLGRALPIIYGAVEKVPSVWCVGQKSTRTNSFGVGDDLYAFASHKCKLGVIPDADMLAGITRVDPVTGASANNGVWTYADFGGPGTNVDQIEISDGLRVEVYWSLEDKRVVDAKISPGNRNWIPNPFPKRWPNAGSNTTPSRLAYRDHSIRLASPLHRVQLVKTLKGESVQAIKMRGGEFDWFDTASTYPYESRGQYPIRYGMGNSKLYVSVEGYQDDADGFYTGNTREVSSLRSSTLLLNDFRPDEMENQTFSTLIKNPADIMLHFIMNYSSTPVTRAMIDLESFRRSRQILEGWRFDTAITDVMGGDQFVERLSAQCCSFVTMDQGKFKMKTVMPAVMKPRFHLIEDTHLVKQRFEYTKTEDIFNSLLFYYKYDYVHGKYSGVIRRDRRNSDTCKRSFYRNGFEKEHQAIEFRDISDDYTANQLADFYADVLSQRRCYLMSEVNYTQDVIDARIEIGDCISVTSALAPGGWREKECIVTDTRKYFNRMEITLAEK